MKYYIKTFQLSEIDKDTLKDYILENKKYFENENATKILLAPWWITHPESNKKEIDSYIKKGYEVWDVEPSELNTKFSKNCFKEVTENNYKIEIGA